MKKILLLIIALSLSLSANSFERTQKVKVVSSTPIYRTVAQDIPYTQCYDEPMHYSRNSYGRRESDSGLGTLIGGVAGGIIGNQVGKGRGKTMATIGGAIVGGIVGNNLSQTRYYDASDSLHVRQRCDTRYHTNYVQEFVGYKNVAYFQGHQIVKITPQREHYIYINKTIHY